MEIGALVVDDSSTMRAIVAKSLRMSGVRPERIRVAGSRDEAVGVLSGGGVRLLFVDADLPGGAASELVELAQGQWATDGREVATVVMSADGDSERIRRLREQGAAAHLRKPFRPEEIDALVKEFGRS